MSVHYYTSEHHKKHTLSEKKDYAGIMANPSVILTSDGRTVDSN